MDAPSFVPYLEGLAVALVLMYLFLLQPDKLVKRRKLQVLAYRMYRFCYRLRCFVVALDCAVEGYYRARVEPSETPINELAHKPQHRKHASVLDEISRAEEMKYLKDNPPNASISAR